MVGGVRDHLGDGNFVIIVQLSIIYYIVFLLCAHIPMGLLPCRITCSPLSSACNDQIVSRDCS